MGDPNRAPKTLPPPLPQRVVLPYEPGPGPGHHVDASAPVPRVDYRVHATPGPTQAPYNRGDYQYPPPVGPEGLSTNAAPPPVQRPPAVVDMHGNMSPLGHLVQALLPHVHAAVAAVQSLPNRVVPQMHTASVDQVPAGQSPPRSVPIPENPPQYPTSASGYAATQHPPAPPGDQNIPSPGGTPNEAAALLDMVARGQMSIADAQRLLAQGQMAQEPQSASQRYVQGRR